MNKYAVIGNPIKHSKSPQIHAAFAEQENIQLNYQRILAPEDSFITTVNKFVESGGLGLNVTLPFKVIAYQQCAYLNEYAKAAGAVNTISFNREKGWMGANTDGIGLLRDLKNNQQLDLTNKHILILGAGGATRGILLPLLEEQPSRIIIANRTVEKAQALASEFYSSSVITACGYKELDTKPFDIIINATSASLDHSLPSIPDSLVNSETVCYDLAYSDSPTLFTTWGQRLNAKQVSDGIGMLIEQAAESYFIWRGFRPDTSELFNALRPGY